MMDACMLAAEILLTHYNENYSNKKQFEQLKNARTDTRHDSHLFFLNLQPLYNKAWVIIFERDKSKFLGSKSRMYFNPNSKHVDVVTDSKRMPSIASDDLEKLADSDNPYVPNEINEKVYLWKTLQKGLKFVDRSDKKHPAKVVYLDPLEAEVAEILLYKR